jgi:hypothetical protein
VPESINKARCFRAMQDVRVIPDQFGGRGMRDCKAAMK